MPAVVIILLVLAVAVLGASAGYVVTRGRRRDAGLEPPVTPRAVSSSTGTAVLGRDDRSDRAVTPELQAEIEDALARADVAPAEVEPEPVEPEVIVRPGFRDRLGKARGLLGGYFGSVLGRSAIDQATWDDLEEALIRADVGIGTTTALLDELKTQVKAEGIKDSTELLEALKTDLKKKLVSADRSLRFEPGRPNVWLFVGVNGVGKTTTIGKIGRREVREGRTVIMAAGDTFRAAAAEQLGLWAERDRKSTRLNSSHG